MPRPFMLVFWSRDPDGTYHNEGESLNRLVPGINSPTSLAANRNADHDLAQLLAALKSLGLDQSRSRLLDDHHGKRDELCRDVSLRRCLSQPPAGRLRRARSRPWPGPAVDRPGHEICRDPGRRPPRQRRCLDRWRQRSSDHRGCRQRWLRSRLYSERRS